ncbi:MAG: hypothetical protein KDK30_11905 [Leptospiraceae bacterium]|nr:hypothetical protein [Leptospiraceae bacterium]MCB1315669.1 hypothetical protein [Leptospiraceae bacterium]
MRSFWKEWKQTLQFKADGTSFAYIFVAVLLGTALVTGAYILHNLRPDAELGQPDEKFITASGKCAECHRQETPAIVDQFEHSTHALQAVTCLDCHQPVENQNANDHRGFEITDRVTAANCSSCHENQYTQYLRSRHAAPAWAAVRGSADFTPEQIAHAEKYHPGAVQREPNQLARMEGSAAIASGCSGCHSVGRPNADGSIGDCSHCHTRHDASIAMAREPETCGQCHMGPDHSQLEIFHESRHGALWNAHKDRMNLSVNPDDLTTRDMPIPSCATCHMSGLEGQKVTHDVTERLSWFLFAAVSTKREHYDRGQANMKELCGSCHSSSHTDAFYEQAEAVVLNTNERVQEARQIMDGLYRDGLLTAQPFDEEIEFLYFDYWHYYGRTAKHGAFMGGADFVQWHGNYELLHGLVQLKARARAIRQGR